MDESNNSPEPAPVTPTEPESIQQTVPEPQPPTESTEPTDPVDEAPITPVEPKKSRKKLWIIIAVIAVLLIGGAAAYFLTRPAKSQPKAVVIKSTTTKLAPTDTPPTTTWSYLATAKPLADLKWFTNLGEQFGYECVDGQSECTTPMLESGDITYTQIGTTKDDKPVIVAWYGAGEMSFAYFAIETSPNTYSVLGRLSGIVESPKSQYTDEIIAKFKKNTATNVSLDETTLPEEFLFPSKISFKNTTFAGTYNNEPSGNFIQSLKDIRGYFFNKQVSEKDLTVVGTDKNHTYYAVTVSDEPLYKIQEVYGTTSSYYSKAYKVDNSFSSDKAADITWNDGTKNTAVYTTRNAGCGSANGYIVAKGLSDSNLTAIGKTGAGETVYQLDNNNALLQKEFVEDYAKGESLEKQSLKNLDINGFQKVHGLVIVKNGLGEYAVYLNTEMFMGGGCAKPVVYLYPTKAQMVDVAVGADVKQSDPYYPSGGWRNVMALPDSRLFYQGKGYSSLFWEGYGFGEYPIITEGSIVASTKAVATITSQMSAQGFNATEIKDFLAYWEPKLPTTPYVRLTWLNTAQMNQLAPLRIQPQPQTVIRTFLEFEGLNKQRAITAQHFTAPARNGFTVTEWGGLLRD